MRHIMYELQHVRWMKYFVTSMSIISVSVEYIACLTKLHGTQTEHTLRTHATERWDEEALWAEQTSFPIGTTMGYERAYVNGQTDI